MADAKLFQISLEEQTEQKLKQPIEPGNSEYRCVPQHTTGAGHNPCLAQTAQPGQTSLRI